MRTEFKAPDELFAEGLVAALKLEPGKVYVILVERHAVTPSTLEYLQSWFRLHGITACTVTTGIPPAKAVRGIEIQHQEA